MNILDLQVSSSLKYRVLFFFSAGVHITFLILFLFNKIYGLATINVFSVLFYIIGGIVSRGNIFKRKYNIAWIISIYVEIVVHALLCTLWLGFGTCFYLYILVALIVSSYITYLSNSRDKFLKIIISCAATTFIALSFSYVFLIYNPPLMTSLFGNSLSDTQIQVMSGINVFTNTFIVFFFSILFIVEMHSLMEKLEETNQKLNYIANHDALTDLYNRHSLKDLFDIFVSGKAFVENDDKSDILDKSVESNHFCVVMGDVDNFKSINDTFGHTCGDLALKSVAKTIKNGVGNSDIACRWGGEEFLILMRGEKDECINQVERIRQNIELLRFEDEEALKITMSFGLAFCDESKNDTANLRKITRIDELVQIADSRLYDAKSRGKNVVVFQ